MEYALSFLIFAAAGAAGFFIFKKLRIPSPAVLGPIVTVAAVNMFVTPLAVSFWLKPILSYVTGFLVGLRFSVRSKGVAVYALALVAWLLILSTAVAKALNAAGIDAATAVFAAFPGGLAEVSLMSLDFGADAFTVALLHASRLILTMALIPAVLARLGVKPGARGVDAAGEASSLKRLWPALLAALALSVLLDKLGAPAGILLGSMLGAGICVRLQGLKIKIGRKFQQCVQIGIGGLVGLSISRDCLLGFTDCLIPILILNVLILGGSALFALFLHRAAKWDWQTSILSASPAGLSPTIMLAMEYGGNVSAVTLFQVVRMVSVLITVPVAAALML